MSLCNERTISKQFKGGDYMALDTQVRAQSHCEYLHQCLNQSTTTTARLLWRRRIQEYNLLSAKPMKWSE
jgi:hypothetical protein